MKCPICGAATEVSETRPGPYELTKRRRRCFNDHRFITLEVYRETFTEQNYRLRKLIASINRRRELWRRDREIARELPTLGWRALAEKYTLTKGAIYLAAKRGRPRHESSNA